MEKTFTKNNLLKLRRTFFFHPVFNAQFQLK